MEYFRLIFWTSTCAEKDSLAAETASFITTKPPRDEVRHTFVRTREQLLPATVKISS